MKLNIGFIKSENQFLLKTIDRQSKDFESKVLDTIEIKETPLNLLFFSGENPPEGLQKTISEESKFYPILSADSLGLEREVFDTLSFEDLGELYAKVNARWILNNNISTIEEMYGTTNHLRDLWANDRNAFFEELWFVLKQNLATAELTAIFHDVKESSGEKADKPSLIHSFVTGEKRPQIFEGGAKEETLMKEYENEFSEQFQITEFDSSKGLLVATIKIGLSPILIMAKLSTFNQLQGSILKGIFSGLQE